MFYQTLEDSKGQAAAVVDPSKIVQKKLSAVDKNVKCLCCIYGDLVIEWVKTPRYVALVQNKDDFVIFIWTSNKIPCFSSSDLQIETTIPITTDLKCSTDIPNKNSQQKEIILSIRAPDHPILLELENKQSTHDFLSQLKRTRDIQSQNVGFGLPSSFPWLKAFQTNTSSFKKSETKKDNPFQTDVFDPLKHMNLESSSKPTAMATSSSTGSGFDDNFDEIVTLSLKPGFKTKSQSRDSLDDLDRNDDFTDSIDSLQQQLGISDGVEMPVGNKPVTARETFVRHYMNEREEEFTNIHPLKIFCGTWNVNGQSPSEPLNEWLCYDDEPPDVYALGFQELDLSNQAYIFSESTKDVEWQKAVRNYLHPGARYRKIKSVRLVGVLLIVFIQEKHIPFVNRNFIDTDSVATGIMGFMGNKGGVSVRLTLHNTSLCFINSHLAAHQEEFERRNQDYRDIESKTKFKQFLPPLNINEHDMIFWIGDLNYRISNLSINEVKKYADEGLYGKMLPHDQLSSQLGKGDVFRGYCEGPITFTPTYRYDTGTNNWDSSEKKRIPAWCDRVLFKGNGIRQLRYNSHQTLCVSDHKPVSALHQCNIRVIDQTKYKKVYEEIMKKLDKIENEYLPQVKLNCTEFYFKDVKFIEPRSDKLVVSNIGQAPVTIEFIKKLDDNDICKPWLQVTPSKAVLKPDEILDIQIDIYVEKSSAAKLNSKEDTLDDILVLHLHGGKDFFQVPVTGNYLPSSFGSSIEALIQMHGPIRELDTPKLVEIEQHGSLDNFDVTFTGGRLYMVPKEIFRMVNHIHLYGLKEESLFQQPGLNSEIQLIRECLDTGTPETLPGSIHSVAESLLLFLEALPESVIPSIAYYKCLETSNNYLLSKQTLKSIPDFHRNVFKYLCAFLRELLKYCGDNNLDVKFLASMFGEVFLRPPKPLADVRLKNDANAKQARRIEDDKRAAFIYHFLTNEYDE